MEDIDVLLDFDSRYGFDEAGPRNSHHQSQHQHPHQQHQQHQHHNSTSSRYSSSTLVNHMPNTFEMSMVTDFHPAAATAAIYPSPTSSERGTTASPQPTTPDLGGQNWMAADEGSGESPSPTEGDMAEGTEAGVKAPAKRKRENRYKNAPPAVLSRRRAQNRASQRAYRERKDQRIKDLEVLLAEQKQKNDNLGQAYTALHAEYARLRAGPQLQTRPAPGPPVMQGPGGMPLYDVGGLGYGATDAMFMYQSMTGDFAS